MKFFLILLFLTTTISSNAQYQLSDAKATTETINLYQNLAKTQQKGYFVGHQDNLAYGVYWKYQDGRNDVKEVVKDSPAIYGWELSDLE